MFKIMTDIRGQFCYQYYINHNILLYQVYKRYAVLILYDLQFVKEYTKQISVKILKNIQCYE